MSGYNENPIIYQSKGDDAKEHQSFDISTINDIEIDEDSVDEVNSEEIFQLIRHLNDPEHPLTLEQLNVAQLDKITVDNKKNIIEVWFTPTIPHCSMATLIGLSIQVKLMRSLPTHFKVDVKITPGTHASEHAVNKQLNDKERVAAALENDKLLDVVEQCIAHTDKGPDQATVLGQ